jgi:23S rRNA (adenine(2503)-C(2))-methyltransferase
MPKRRRELRPQPIFDPGALAAFLRARGSTKPERHCSILWKYLLRTPGASLEKLGSCVLFPKRFVRSVQLHFAVFTTRVLHASTSSDGSTTKLLLALQDGLEVETVVIRHGCTTARRISGERRTTVCVSSQVGCKMGCKFCATGTMGEIGSLWSGEILEQVIHARRYSEVRNIVFMGMGEPMNNYDAVVSAVQALVDKNVFGLSPNRVTVSTVGIVPRMQQFVHDLPNISLALSLHAPNQYLRASFVPAARAYPLPRLMEAVDHYIRDTGRKILVEYCLLRGVNDSMSHANELGALLQGRNVTLNLIPYNSTAVEARYGTPDKETIDAFANCVLKSYGVRTTVRKEMGGDVAAACGQLVVEKGEGGESPLSAESTTAGNAASSKAESEGYGGVAEVRDIEDLMSPTKSSRLRSERREALQGHRKALRRSELQKQRQQLCLKGGGIADEVGQAMSWDQLASLMSDDSPRDPSFSARVAEALFPQRTAKTGPVKFAPTPHFYD